MFMDWREFINHLLLQDLKLSPKEVEAETGIKQPIINRWMLKGLKKQAHRYTIRRLEKMSVK